RSHPQIRRRLRHPHSLQYVRAVLVPVPQEVGNHRLRELGPRANRPADDYMMSPTTTSNPEPVRGYVRNGVMNGPEAITTPCAIHSTPAPCAQAALHGKAAAGRRHRHGFYTAEAIAERKAVRDWCERSGVKSEQTPIQSSSQLAHLCLCQSFIYLGLCP